MNVYTFALSLDKKYRGKQVIIRQGDDDGTTITATLYDQGVPFTETGYTAKFKMALPDGKNYYRADATYSAGVVSVVLDEEYAASVPGRTETAYFEITKNSKVYSTEPICVVIRPSATEGMTEGRSYDDEITSTITGWLDSHPEAVTTVADDSLTTAKYKDASVTADKLAVGSVTIDKLDSSLFTVLTAEDISAMFE